MRSSGARYGFGRRRFSTATVRSAVCGSSERASSSRICSVDRSNSGRSRNAAARRGPRRHAFVQPPLRRKQIADWLGVATILLLDARTSRQAGGLGMVNAGVLVDLAEQVLAIDELKRSTP